MPNAIDLFPSNYGVTSSPLDTLSIDPMQFINGVATPFGGTAANPIGNPLALAITGLNGLIDMVNQVISSTLGTNAALLPNITQLVNLLETCLGPFGFLTGMFQGIPFVNLLFGGLTGTGPGSGTGLFGQSSLFGAGGLFGGFTSGIPILSQLIGAGGGNASAPNLITEFVNLFTGSGGVGFGQLISMFTNIIPGLSGLGGLTSIFTDIMHLLGNPTSLGGGSPSLPGVNSIPLLGGLFGSTGLLGGLTSGMPILNQLIGLIPGTTGGLTGLSGLGSIFTDLFGLLGTPTGVGTGSPTLPGIGSIPILSSLQQLIDGVSGGSSNPITTLINDLVYGIGTIDPARITHVPISAIGNGIGSTTQQTPNLILNPTFDGATSVIANDPNWHYDGTVDHTGAAGSGSAKTTANGTPLTLLSNPMAVSSGQQFSFSGYAKWSGLVSTGSPIWIGLQTYDSVGNPVSSPVLQAVSSPGASGGWTLLTATWTAPAGVTTVRVALNVGSGATAGTVWFDDLDAHKTGLMSGSWMTGIAGTVAQDLQAIPDTFFNFLNGGSSSGNPLGGLPGSLGSLFGGLVPGAVGNGDGTASVANIFTPITDLFQGIASFGDILGTNPTAGVLFNNGDGTASTPMHAIQNLGGLVGTVQGLAGSLQGIVDGIFNSTMGTSTSGNPISSVPTALSNIPFANVTGILGPANVGGSVQSTVDGIVQGLNGVFGSGFSLGHLSNAAQSVSATASTAQTVAQSAINATAIQNNRPAAAGFERTVESNITTDSLGTGASPSSVAVTQAVSAGGYVRMSQAKTVGFSQFFYVSKSGTVSAFYLNFAKQDPTSGDFVPLFSSGDLSSSLSTPGWVVYNWPGVDQLAVSASDVIVCEYQVVGSGTVNIAGLGQSWQTNHPVAATKKSGFTRNTGATGPTSLSVANASISWGGNYPYVGVGVSTLPPTYQPPTTTTYSTHGTYTYNIPSWLVSGNKIDIILVGAGGGGHSGGTWGVGGNGGGAGAWSAITLTYGVDIPLTTTTISVTVGTGGAASSGNGTASSVSITGYGGSAITAAGGAGGPGYQGGAGAGASPGNETWNSILYFGGPQQNNMDAAGQKPGGGGGGGDWVAFGNGGPGADGGAWIVARQS